MKDIKLLKEIMGKKPQDIRFGNNLFDIRPKAQAIKAKIDT